MLELEPAVQDELDRVLQQFVNTGEPLGANALSVFDVVRAHFLIANHFLLEGEGIGGIGPRDVNLLESAVARQHVSFGGTAKWSGLFDIVSTLFFGLIKNHPFYDANKRTALLSMLYHLYKNGWCPSISEWEIEDFTVDVAENNLGKYSRYKEMLREADPEVRFISKFLKKNSRKIDHSPRNITYRELKVVLERYGFRLENAGGNYVDIFTTIPKEQRHFLGFLKKTTQVDVRLGQVGFPRWTAQVGKSDLKKVRALTKLSARDGVDTGAFFAGLDPMQSLITGYNAPLMRLAYR